MPRIDEEIIKKLAESNDIVEIINGYFPLKRVGANYQALCPFHQEKSPSFHVSPARQSFHCFGCGVGGGVFRFVMDYEKVDFVTAVKKLAQRSGILLVAEKDSKEQYRYNIRSRLLELHCEVAKWFHENLLSLPETSDASNYLKQRGLSREIIRNWQIGYAPLGWQSLRSWAEMHGFSREELITGGLLIASEGDQKRSYDRFRNRLIFPIRNDYGEVIAFSGRILNSSQKEAKYLNSPETAIFSKGHVLFGLDKSKRFIIDTGSAVILEGQIDLIASFEHGIKNVVAPQGTAFTLEQARLLQRFATQVILCFDADSAGEQAIKRSLPSLLQAGLHVRVAQLPINQDPDSLIRDKGIEAFQNRLTASCDFFDYMIEKAVTTSCGNFGHQQKADVARHLAPYLILLPDVALRETTTAHVASMLGISINALHEAATKYPLSIANNKLVPDPSCAQKNLIKVSASTELICRLALLSPEVRHWITKQKFPSPEELDPELKLLHDLLDPLQNMNDCSPSALLALLPQRLQSLVSSWDLQKAPISPLSTVQDAFRNLKLIDIKKRQNAAVVRLGRSGLSGDMMLSIQKEILDLQQKINELAAATN